LEVRQRHHVEFVDQRNQPASGHEMPSNESERREYQQHQTPGEQQLANLNHPSSYHKGNDKGCNRQKHDGFAALLLAVGCCVHINITFISAV
jgi:hypothetical protein